MTQQPVFHIFDCLKLFPATKSHIFSSPCLSLYLLLKNTHAPTVCTHQRERDRDDGREKEGQGEGASGEFLYVKATCWESASAGLVYTDLPSAKL